MSKFNKQLLQVGVMIFFGYFLIYIVRYNLSVHIVDMVEVSKKFLYSYYNETDILRTKAKLVRSQVRKTIEI